MKVKKLWCITLASVFVLLVAVGSVGCAGPTPPGEVIEFNFDNPWPPTHWQAVGVFDPWASEVEETTDGWVKINMFHGGTLSTGAEVWEGTIAGRWDMGVWYPPYKEELFPKISLTTLPFAYPDFATANEGVEYFMENYCMEEYEEVKYCSIYSADIYALFTNKPIRTPDDLKGMKIRIPASAWVDIIQAWGAEPVSVSSGEMYSALDKGIVDAVFYPFLGAIGLKLPEVAQYAVDVNCIVPPTSIIMNKESWNTLPADYQNLFDSKLFPLFNEYAGETIMEGSPREWKALEDQGRAIYLTDAERAVWVQSTAFAWDKRVEDLNAAGLPGDAYMADFKKSLQEIGVG